MDSLNNYISDASLIKSFCKHNKMHIQEIDRLQTLNRELEELVAELNTKLERLEEIETISDTLEQDTEHTDKQLKAVVHKIDYIISLKERSQKTQKKYSKLKYEHDLLMERYAKIDRNVFIDLFFMFILHFNLNDCSILHIKVESFFNPQHFLNNGKRPNDSCMGKNSYMLMIFPF